MGQDVGKRDERHQRGQVPFIKVGCCCCCLLCPRKGSEGPDPSPGLSTLSHEKGSRVAHQLAIQKGGGGQVAAEEADQPKRIEE